MVYCLADCWLLTCWDKDAFLFFRSGENHGKPPKFDGWSRQFGIYTVYGILWYTPFLDTPIIRILLVLYPIINYIPIQCFMVKSPFLLVKSPFGRSNATNYPDIHKLFTVKITHVQPGHWWPWMAKSPFFSVPSAERIRGNRDFTNGFIMWICIMDSKIVVLWCLMDSEKCF
jgi:hypothetical protein